ncbi:hypothetical protein WV31_04940 [Magnetospirillum sp. ME-1]|uniref:winged helix domain-containing protein n=1 Tax=Magnetospirillum sp. ME-1 TaxID=1639348 RepID=UPI000A17D4BD|nr:helix-turn-helix domain-containing protein [Magnetospirillum sp. ME-1]ARJ65054.1 hypothetical protein WV31_04940 [Magnetospirillum sp. ME-1]
MAKHKQAATVVFETISDHASARLTGRDLWAFDHLHKAGSKGCTPIDTPGPRWSAYVHNLRKMGLDIETVWENHGGPYPGKHARYVLATIILDVFRG